MPKYNVETDQGSFVVELDQPPSDINQLKDLVGKHLSSGVPNQSAVADNAAADVKRAQETGSSLLQAQKANTQPQGAPITSQPARFPTVEKAAREYAIPAATAAAGLLTGGASIPVQAAVGAGGEAIAQLASGKELNPASIATAGALPGVAQGASKLVGYGMRSVANQVARQHMAKAAVGAVEKNMGVGARATEALAKAGAKATPVHDFAETFKVLDDIIKKEPRLPGGSKGAKDFAEETLGKLTDPTQPPFKYNEMFESSQAIREAAEAAGDNRTKKRIYEVRQALINDIDKLGPEAKEAFQLYRKQQAIKEVSTTLQGTGFVGSKMSLLIKNDPLIAGAFSEAEKKTLETISSRIGPEGLQKILAVAGALGASGGTAMAAPLLVGALIQTPKIGEVFARSLITPNGTVSKVAWPAFAQFMRGYIAEQEGQ